MAKEINRALTIAFDPDTGEFMSAMIELADLHDDGRVTNKGRRAATQAELDALMPVSGKFIEQTQAAMTMCEEMKVAKEAAEKAASVSEAAKEAAEKQSAARQEQIEARLAEIDGLKAEATKEREVAAQSKAEAIETLDAMISRLEAKVSESAE